MQAEVVFSVRKQDKRGSMWALIAGEHRPIADVIQRVVQRSQSSGLGVRERRLQLRRIGDSSFQFDPGVERCYQQFVVSAHALLQRLEKRVAQRSPRLLGGIA
jgi:hypothetical protein